MDCSTQTEADPEAGAAALVPMTVGFVTDFPALCSQEAATSPTIAPSARRRGGSDGSNGKISRGVSFDLTTAMGQRQEQGQGQGQEALVNAGLTPIKGVDPDHDGLAAPDSELRLAWGSIGSGGSEDELQHLGAHFVSRRSLSGGSGGEDEVGGGGALVDGAGVGGLFGGLFDPRSSLAHRTGGWEDTLVLAMGSADGHIHVFNIARADPRLVEHWQTIDAHTGLVGGAVFQPHPLEPLPSLVSFGADGLVLAWARQRARHRQG